MPDGEPSALETDRKRIPLIRWLIPCTFIGILTIGYLVATWLEKTQTQLEWISFQDVWRGVPPGPLQRLKSKLVSIAGPVLKWYKPNRPNIRIDVHVDLFSVPAQWEASSAGIGSPFSTNHEGAKAWILQETELRRVSDEIKDANGVNYISLARVALTEGRPVQLECGQRNVPFVSPTGSGSYPVGMTVALSPKVAAHSIRLAVGVTSTATNGVNMIRTNVAVCSRALLPNGGGLLLSVEGKDSSANTNF